MDKKHLKLLRVLVYLEVFATVSERALLKVPPLVAIAQCIFMSITMNVVLYIQSTFDLLIVHTKNIIL